MAKKRSEPASAIEAMRAFLLQCPYLTEKTDELLIEFPDVEAVSAAISSNGRRTLKSYIDGTTVKEHDFVFQTREMTVEDADKLYTSEFYEKLDEWIDIQVMENNLPQAIGHKFRSVTASNAMLFNLDDDGDQGVYQIQIKAVYAKGE